METFELTAVVLLMLCIAAVAAGYLDTLVGGGGLITIPALLMAGMPPILALGTNKLQSVVGTGTASLMMVKRGKLRIRDVKKLMLAAFTGSVLGSVVVQFFDTELLRVLIPIVIVLIALYFILSPQQSLHASEVKLTENTYAKTAVPTIGFYDGMFGPGTGSFFVLSGVSLRGQEIVASTATAKTLNFATNFGSLLVFIAFGKIIWLVGGVMMIGQAIGANLGAKTLLSIDPAKLRYLVIALCLVMLAAWFWGSGA